MGAAGWCPAATILKQFEFRELLGDNLHLAVYEALKTITQEDMSGFFSSLDISIFDNMNILFCFDKTTL